MVTASSIPEEEMAKPKPIKALRAFYKNRLATPIVDELLVELDGQSDRAAVILAASIIDNALVYRISVALPTKPNDKEFESIFRFEGPLGTFSSRIELAYLFGLIDSKTRSQLDDLREMRNACAHSPVPISFATLELANVAKRVTKPANLMPVEEMKNARDIRKCVIVATIILVQILINGSREAGIRAFKKTLFEADGLAPSPHKSTPL
jgi:DNA-binding MltR family transcriptional regulator